MGELVYAESAASPARAFGIIEDEVVRPDISVDQVMRRAAVCSVESFGFGLACTLDYVWLQQSIAHQQRARNSGPNCFFVFSAHDESIHNGIHLRNGFVASNFRGNIHRLAIDDQATAPFFP